MAMLLKAQERKRTHIHEKEEIKGTHSQKLPEPYYIAILMKEIYVAPTCYNQGPLATIVTTLMLHFPLKLSKTSEMQHQSRKTISFLPLSKITAR